MNNEIYSFLLSQILLIPLCAALIRLRKIEKTYEPFIFMLALGAIQEVISFWLIRGLHRTNAPSVNIYGLLECGLLFWQFYAWNSFGSRYTRRKWFFALQGGSLVLWICCNLVFFHLNDFDLPLYRILYPFVVVLLSVNEINRMITHDNRNLYKNARFVICLAFIIFFLYQILYEGATSLASETDNGVSKKIIHLFNYVNAFVNGLYLLGVLLMPRRRGSAFERIFDRIRDDG
ncbi:MAG TPA: hypothetical protein VL547_10615 [Dinghuibacter sp.]|uniref:hypothetical protein n=1 Tax=Dinghuibacter sp. TaxID=2024697 RepID=UPI002C8131D0|nr:hypothetical protein [Dinghuibacter sp.]HTJ12470.1 hypothetical protein [Dinghuibacter sp.]